ncbi:hypothetical protein SEUCBS140593_002177 [Sporothrix eucalyptigena]|uniref:Beta-lactamase-related domain-containing protein n=1 Tax=Sporothrix eucalyptigena TaxID=1812306 RepID=A0ABP0B4C2_9PEZI
MAELDEILARYTHPQTGSLHGAAFVAVDRNGKDIYRGVAGRKYVDLTSTEKLTLDTVTWIASQSKLVTSVSVLIAVEKGLIGLDDDVRKVVPLLENIQVITGFEDGEGEPGPGVGKPILEDPNGPITLRQLVTHTSGFCYDAWNPLLQKYSVWAGRKENMFSGTIEGQLHPLIFQPGTSWSYGPGLDWAGKVIESLTGITFDEFQQQNIWGPLGAKSTTFFPAKRGLTQKDIMELGRRSENSPPQDLVPGTSPWPFDCRDSLGGAGLFSTANDYCRLLAALVSGGGPILSAASLDELCRPQVGVASDADMRRFVTSDSNAHSKGWLWTTDPENHWQDYMEVRQCLCGLVNSEDVVDAEGKHRRRRKGTVNWDGLPNLLWFVDRESGVAATFFTQIMPMDDVAARKVCTELEEALYRIVNEETKV